MPFAFYGDFYPISTLTMHMETVILSSAYSGPIIVPVHTSLERKNKTNSGANVLAA